MKTCAVDGCVRKYRARGLCSTHYNATYQPDRHRPRSTDCHGCGARFDWIGGGAKGSPRRPTCSADCWYLVTFGRARPSSALVHVGRLTPSRTTTTPTVVVAPTARGFVAGQCLNCGDAFVLDLRSTRNPGRYCSQRCLRRATRRFHVSDKVRQSIYERDDWICQLCTEPVDRNLNPQDLWAASLDHIVCQSWTLIPDHSPSNLRLAHRMCNSIRGDRVA